MNTKHGLDVLLEDVDRLAGDRLGLVTNQTGVTADLRYNRERMLDAGLDLKQLFSPEHGLWGIADAGEEVGDYVDEMTDLPGESLFGDRHAPSATALSDLDTLVFDIQDIGVRCWTYTTTMAHCMQAAAEYDLQFVVLDRPNPIAPVPLEGTVMPEEWASFVGLQGLPLLYGMTIGELAGFVNEEHEVGADLDVVELRGWDRDMWYDETGLPWVPSIPQLSHLEKALIYPATVLLEGTNVTPGWGTGRGPMLAGAPWLDRQETVRSARENIESAGLSGVGIRSDRFRPRHGVIPQYVDTVCDGFQIHVTDRDTFRPLATGLCLLAAIHDANDEFEWTTREFRDETVFWTDQLAGTEKYRQRISEAEPIADVIAATTEGLEEYRGRYEQQLRY